ncbi:hypothetical protein LPMP_203190 [Leishmania panamensis]|uniref:Uncharacterized protein n=4 Tax=Viannia TaxID=37616 RepID=A4HB66_LEIBR|nr:conserved hypothetical protein [Leishmania braziliensis MHOM/BR/75/M2904]XP_010698521.1 hypothetical protein LPMP_203190 [Leishmania panamensis]KAI5686578.1 hypothetical protein MNV84_03219 [Leishmania braziliensis]AIN97814.1 hypothetical protein LPMP_203190 [Leishmania panamensis]CAJ2471607.1 unnamed protein product [Leishmania braziliensis]CAJ2472212.1 unnamed protein product [Leishmania braziliensis]CAM38652.2 conserved hypothetical protein [Leishmania braziliensis MHOM/BR/75/M2904]
MDPDQNISYEALLLRYVELRDAARDLISANPKHSLNVHDTYLRLCQTYGYPLNNHYTEYLTRYAKVQAAIATGSQQGMLNTVRRLDFLSTYVGKFMWIPIFVTLSDCVLLHSLSLSCQQLDSDLVLLLTQSLSPLVQLASLDVSGNPIGCIGVQALIRLVQSSPTLTQCNIYGAASIVPLTRRLDAVLARNREHTSPSAVASH